MDGTLAVSIVVVNNVRSVEDAVTNDMFPVIDVGLALGDAGDVISAPVIVLVGTLVIEVKVVLWVDGVIVDCFEVEVVISEVDERS